MGTVRRRSRLPRIHRGVQKVEGFEGGGFGGDPAGAAAASAGRERGRARDSPRPSRVPSLRFSRLGLRGASASWRRTRAEWTSPTEDEGDEIQRRAATPARSLARELQRQRVRLLLLRAELRRGALGRLARRRSASSSSASSKPAPVDPSDCFSPSPRDPSTTSVISPRGWRVSNSAIASDSVPLQNSS